MKHIAVTLGALCLLATTLVGQVKEKFQDKDYKNRTVVIKESEDVNDIEILNSQFNIDDVKVGEVVRITTGRDAEVSIGAPKKKALKKNQNKKLQASVSKKKVRKLKSTAVTFNNKKRKKKKAVFVYDQYSKKKRRKGLNDKCYKF